MARANESSGAGDQRDLKADLAALRARLEEAEGYLRLDHLRERRAELEKEVSRPDLWDDPDLARRISSEFGSVGDDIELLEDLGRRLSDGEVLYQLMVEEGDDSVAGELTGGKSRAEKKPGVPCSIAVKMLILFAQERVCGFSANGRRGTQLPSGPWMPA